MVPNQSWAMFKGMAQLHSQLHSRERQERTENEIGQHAVKASCFWKKLADTRRDVVSSFAQETVEISNVAVASPPAQ
jgi:hypothetical protein